MPLHQSTPDDWETNKKVMATNLDAPIHLNTPVQVVEIIPYILATPASHPAFHGVDLTVFAKHCLQKIFEGVVEVGYESDHIIRGSRDALDAQFVRYNDKVERILGDTIRGMQNERKKQKV
eukprot:gene26622-33229_t